MFLRIQTSGPPTSKGRDVVVVVFILFFILLLYFPIQSWEQDFDQSRVEMLPEEFLYHPDMRHV